MQTFETSQTPQGFEPLHEIDLGENQAQQLVFDVEQFDFKNQQFVRTNITTRTTFAVS